MKKELEEKYKSFLARRKGRKLYSFLIFLLVASMMFGWIFILFTELWGLVAWGAIVLLLFAILKITPTPPTEPPENNMFLKFCDTLRNIELHFNDPQSEIHLTRASKNLREVSSLIRGIRPSSYSMMIKKAINDPLERLASNLEKRILPLLRYPSNSKDVQKAYSRLEALAFIFIEPVTIVENLSLCNEILEEITPIEIWKVSLLARFRGRFSDFRRTEIGILTISLMGGFILILLGSLIYCLFYNKQIATFAHDNPYIIFIGGTALSALIGTILTRKH